MELIKTDNENVNNKEIVDFIHSSYKYKPNDLIISEVKWKHLVRSVIRGKNILILGPTGSGKTLASKTISKILNKTFFYFNLGASQDPRTFLIGNTQYKKDTGTFFNESAFIKAIKTKNSVILLDEISRAHPDAWNILMTVLDETQRYIRLDEKEECETIFVESNVTFIATANIGNEYTSTRTLDKALFDRFVILEMDTLNKEEEYELLKTKYPNANNILLNNIAEIVYNTRKISKMDNSKITNSLSTRQSVEMAGLVNDGFNLLEIAEVLIYPSFSDDGVDSERTYMKQYIQKFINVTDKNSDNLFNVSTNPF